VAARDLNSTGKHYVSKAILALEHDPDGSVLESVKRHCRGAVLLLALQPLGYAQAEPKTMLGWPATSPTEKVEELGIPQVMVNGVLVDEFQYVDDIRDQLLDVVVNDERDLEDIAPSLTISGTEQLRFHSVSDHGQRSIYTFIEWIDDIMTEHEVRFEVDDETRRIVEVGGRMQADIDVPRTPALPEQQALALTIDCVRNGGPRNWYVPIKFDGTHESRKLLKNGEIWWGIGLELEGPPSDGEGGTFLDVTHDWYWVRPDGTVEPWQSGDCSHCGATSLPHCGPSRLGTRSR
jgi:hypothetical protein